MGVAGCLSRIGADAEVAITDINSGPEEYGIELDAELSDNDFSDDDPPHLELELTNAGDYEIDFLMWGDYRVADFHLSRPSGLLTIVDHERDNLNLSSMGCWSHEAAGLEPDDHEYSGTWQPGDSESDTRYLVQWDDDLSRWECLDPGEYTFSDNFDIGEDEVTVSVEITVR